jgi:two-component system, OmpR family, sensor kinase
MMHSLYSRIMAASFAILVLSLVSFVVIFSVNTGPTARRGMGRFQKATADTTEAVYESGGRDALKRHLEILSRNLAVQYWFLDPRGVDMLSGEDRAQFLRQTGPPWRAVAGDHGPVVVTATTDAKYRLATQLPPPPIRLYDIAPYYALVLLAVAASCWILASGIASPIRRLAGIVEQFGRGNLSARAAVKGRSEIADLSRAYNSMADRIVALINTERQLLQDISHELRTPLTRLNIAIELARTALNREAAAEQLQAEADRLNTLVTCLLETARTEGHLAESLDETVDVPAILRDVVSAIRPTAAAREINVVLEMSANLRTLGNGELLRRAFENVLTNAITYGPAGSRVTIICRRCDDDIAVIVRDHGTGVPEKSLAELGMPFFRVDPSRSANTGGLGLGLAITRRAVHLHNGTVTFENAGPGLRVTIILPLRAQAAIGQGPPEEPVHGETNNS